MRVEMARINLTRRSITKREGSRGYEVSLLRQRDKNHDEWFLRALCFKTLDAVVCCILHIRFLFFLSF